MAVRYEPFLTIRTTSSHVGGQLIFCDYLTANLTLLIIRLSSAVVDLAPYRVCFNCFYNPNWFPILQAQIYVITEILD